MMTEYYSIPWCSKYCDDVKPNGKSIDLNVKNNKVDLVHSKDSKAKLLLQKLKLFIKRINDLNEPSLTKLEKILQNLILIMTHPVPLIKFIFILKKTIKGLKHEQQTLRSAVIAPYKKRIVLYVIGLILGLCNLVIRSNEHRLLVEERRRTRAEEQERQERERERQERERERQNIVQSTQSTQGNTEQQAQQLQEQNIADNLNITNLIGIIITELNQFLRGADYRLNVNQRVNVESNRSELAEALRNTILRNEQLMNIARESTMLEFYENRQIRSEAARLINSEIPRVISNIEYRSRERREQIIHTCEDIQNTRDLRTQANNALRDPLLTGHDLRMVVERIHELEQQVVQRRIRTAQRTTTRTAEEIPESSEEFERQDQEDRDNLNHLIDTLERTSDIQSKYSIMTEIANLFNRSSSRDVRDTIRELTFDPLPFFDLEMRIFFTRNNLNNEDNNELRTALRRDVLSHFGTRPRQVFSILSIPASVREYMGEQLENTRFDLERQRRLEERQRQNAENLNNENRYNAGFTQGTLRQQLAQMNQNNTTAAVRSASQSGFEEERMSGLDYDRNNRGRIQTPNDRQNRRQSEPENLRMEPRSNTRVNRRFRNLVGPSRNYVNGENNYHAEFLQRDPDYIRSRNQESGINVTENIPEYLMNPNTIRANTIGLSANPYFMRSRLSEIGSADNPRRQELTRENPDAPLNFQLDPNASNIESNNRYTSIVNRNNQATRNTRNVSYQNRPTRNVPNVRRGNRLLNNLRNNLMNTVQPENRQIRQNINRIVPSNQRITQQREYSSPKKHVKIEPNNRYSSLDLDHAPRITLYDMLPWVNINNILWR